MGFLFLAVILAYLFGLLIILVIVRFVTGSNKIVVFLAVVLILLPFWREMLVNTVFRFYDLTSLQEIHKTIEKPESVYWEDNVWPGFTEYYTKAMIECYLDGINLKVLALNGEDGKVYLYQAEAEDYNKSKALLPELERRQLEIDAIVAKSTKIKSTTAYKESGKKNKAEHRKRFGAMINKAERELVPFTKQYGQQLSQDIQAIMDRAKIFTSPKDLPPMNYKVEFNKIPVFPSFLEKLIISDKITITDNKTKAIMAFSKRYLAYSGWLATFSGNQPKFGKVLGYHSVYKFDNNMLFQYAKNKGFDTRHEHELRDYKL